MSLSLYLNQNTWVHRLDARTKVLSILGLFTLELVFSDPRYLLIVGAFVGLCFMTSGVLANLKKFWILLVLLFGYSVVLWPFFVEGQTPLFRVGQVVLTEEGLAFAVGMGLRLGLMVISGVLLLSTTTVEDFAQALQRLGLPPAMGFAFSLAFRWVPTLLGAGGTIIQAQRSRGFDLSSGTLLTKIRRYPPLVVPLIGHTLRQTNLLAMALESKGIGPGQKRKPLPLIVNGILGLPRSSSYGDIGRIERVAKNERPGNSRRKLLILSFPFVKG